MVPRLNRQSTTQKGRLSLKIAIAAGGTGGHISPVVAVLEELNRLRIPYDAVWIGSSGPFERETANEWAIPFRSIQVGKLRRYISIRTISDSARIPIGVAQARRILSRFKPDVVFSTGGYVGVPAVVAARSLRIPSLTHEQTAILGLATRINARFSDTIALSYATTSRPKHRKGAKIVVTGNPVRTALRDGCADEIATAYDLSPDSLLTYVTGGAQGASALNRAVEDALPELLNLTQVIHQCGPDQINGDFSRMLKRRDELQPDLAARYRPVERVSGELKHIYAAADLVVGRSGAGTVAELAYFGLPSILIPLPGAAEARKNAEALLDSGGAVVLDQSELTPARLVTEVSTILGDSNLRESMGRNSRTIAQPDAAKKLVDEIVTLGAGGQETD